MAYRNKTIQIDPDAATTVERKIIIHAPLTRVWQIQTDIDRWNEWSSSVQWSSLEGPLDVGSVFRRKSMGTNCFDRSSSSNRCESLPGPAGHQEF